MSVILRKKFVLKGRENGNGIGKKKREGKRGMRREKGEKELVWCFLFLVGYSPLCVWVGKKGWEEKEWGKRGRGVEEG